MTTYTYGGKFKREYSRIDDAHTLLNDARNIMADLTHHYSMADSDATELDPDDHDAAVSMLEYIIEELDSVADQVATIRDNLDEVTINYIGGLTSGE